MPDSKQINEVEQGMNFLTTMGLQGTESPYMGVQELFDAYPLEKQTIRPPFDDPKLESEFQNWYKETYPDLNPNPDDPLQYYDYRDLFLAGGKPEISPVDQQPHSSSIYKLPEHPNRYVSPEGTELMDSITGVPILSRTGQRPSPIDYFPTSTEPNLFPMIRESGEAFGTEPPARDIVGVQPQGFPASDIALPKGSALKQRILEGYQRAAPEEEQELFSTTHKDKWGEVKGKNIFINEDRFKKEGATEGYLEDMFFAEALHGLKDSVPEWYDRLYAASEQDLADPNSPFSQWKKNSFSVVTGEAPDEHGVKRTENLYGGTIDDWWDESRFDNLVGGYLFAGEDASQPSMRSWNRDRMPYGPNFRKELEAFKQALEEEDVAPSVDIQSMLLHEMLKNLLGGVPRR